MKPTSNQNSGDDASPIASKIHPALPGWPGYRTRPGRSGYDPLDTRFEAAFMTGTLLRRFFTGQLRTNNPVYLTLMVIVSVGLLIPFVVSLVESFGLQRLSSTFACSGPVGLIGLIFLLNVALNLKRGSR